MATDVHQLLKMSQAELDELFTNSPAGDIPEGQAEGTAIVVTGDRFEVIGKWKVAIHDNTRPYQPWEKQYFVLSPGDVYNMKTRAVEKYGTGSPVPPVSIK